MELIDLTMSDDEEVRVISPHINKEIKCEPSPQPSHNSDEADHPPHLESALSPPVFNLAEIALGHLASSAPPVLEAEVPVPVSNPMNVIAHETSISNENDAELPEVYHTPQFKTYRRVANPNNTNVGPERKKLTITLNNTIKALKVSSPQKSPQSKNFKHATPARKRSISSSSETPTPQRPNEGKARRESGITGEQRSILQEKFVENPDPYPSDIHEISETTGLSTQNVKRWFSNAKKKLVPNQSQADNDNIQYNGHVQGETPQRNRDESVHVGAGCSYSRNNSHSQEAAPAHTSSPQSSKPKYIRTVESRTKILDVETLQQDVEKVQQYDRQRFKQLLKTQWQTKAKRILKLATDKKETVPGMRTVLYKEAQKIKDVLAGVVTFSDDQDEEIKQWRSNFITEMSAELTSTDNITIEHIVDNVVMPWAPPFIYSKTTTQNGRLLALTVALCDLAKISKTMGWNELEWKTPLWLQYDL